jgi:dihydroxyacetone kinase-like predicted kinase
MTKIKLEKSDVITMLDSAIAKAESKMDKIVKKCYEREFNYLTGKSLESHKTFRSLLGLWTTEDKAREYLNNLKTKNSTREFVRLIYAENHSDYDSFWKYCEFEEQLEELQLMKKAFTAHSGNALELSLKDFKKLQ